MGEQIYTHIENNNAAFSVATLIYTRLRRQTGRVIDALYLSTNLEYAKHVIELALATQDADLQKYADNLKQILGLEEEKIEEEVKEHAMASEELEPFMPSYEATEEEVYKAQVSHHYIGSLR